jgi:hypothetical protein
VWRLPRENREKPDVGERERPPLDQPSRLREVVPPPVPEPAATGFEVHEALPAELQQPPITKAPVEAYASATQAVGKRADSKMNIVTLLVSKSGLREAILLREILGPPRALQELDFV